MIAIIQWELSRRRMFLLWWCIGIVILFAVLMSIYPSIHQQAAQLDTIMQQLPDSIRSLRGGDSDLSSPVGYLSAEVFYITLPLLLIIMAINLGGSLLARDEQDRTLELVLARPVSRGQVLLAKAVSGILLMSLVGTVGSVAIIILAHLVNMDINLGYLFLTCMVTTLFGIAFGAIAFMLSAASIMSRKVGIAVAVTASFGGYLLQSLSSLSDFINIPAKLLPYHYFVPKEILNGDVASGFIMYIMGIFIICAIVSYLGFRRRDIS
jgi:ABC-2 type transport system permease protein